MAKKTIQLSIENVNRLFGSYKIGNKQIQATYKQPKGTMRLYLDLGSFSQDISDEELNKKLSKYKLIIED